MPDTKSVFLNIKRAGESTGGNAEDAPPATANSVVGFATLPRRQSHMYGVEKRHTRRIAHSSR